MFEYPKILNDPFDSIYNLKNSEIYSIKETSRLCSGKYRSSNKMSWPHFISKPFIVLFASGAAKKSVAGEEPPITCFVFLLITKYNLLTCSKL